jgi:hypothetical protein
MVLRAIATQNAANACQLTNLELIRTHQRHMHNTNVMLEVLMKRLLVLLTLLLVVVIPVAAQEVICPPPPP